LDCDESGIFTPKWIQKKSEFALRITFFHIDLSLRKPELCSLFNSTLVPVKLIHKYTHRNNAAGLWVSPICWSRV